MYTHFWMVGLPDHSAINLHVNSLVVAVAWAVRDQEAYGVLRYRGQQYGWKPT